MGQIVIDYDDSLIETANGDQTTAEVFAVMAWAAKQLDWQIMVWAGENPTEFSPVGLIAVVDPERVDEYNYARERRLSGAEESDERVGDTGESR